MVLQDKYGSIQEAHKTQIPPMHPWRHAEMGGWTTGGPTT